MDAGEETLIPSSNLVTIINGIMLPSGISTHGYKSPRFNIDQTGDIVSY